MAWSSAVLSSTELALFAADKPILGANVISETPTVCRWNNEGTTTGTDHTLSGYSALRGYDGFVNLDTRTDAAFTTIYYVLQFSEAIDLDFVGIIGHNLTSKTVTVEIDDAGTFASATEIGSFGTIADTTRVIDWALYHTASTARRYSGVSYLRFKMTGSSFTPMVNEFIVGRRRQLKTNPLEPYDPTSLHGNASINVTSSGVRIKNVYHRGRFDLNCELGIHETAYQSDLTGFWTDNKQGKRPFIWCPQPTTYPDNWYYMMQENMDFDFPYVGFTERRLTIEAKEQGPDTYFLSRGVY